MSINKVLIAFDANNLISFLFYDLFLRIGCIIQRKKEKNDGQSGIVSSTSLVTFDEENEASFVTSVKSYIEKVIAMLTRKEFRHSSIIHRAEKKDWKNKFQMERQMG